MTSASSWPSSSPWRASSRSSSMPSMIAPSRSSSSLARSAASRLFVQTPPSGWPRQTASASSTPCRAACSWPSARARRARPSVCCPGRQHHGRLVSQAGALALAEGRVADLRSAAAHSSSTASTGRRHRRRLRALALGLAAIVALAPTGALAQPMHDAAAPAKAQAEGVHRHHRPSATRPSITFTNPLGRSRGPGAGAGLL
jgi:hypothetical protein